MIRATQVFIYPILLVIVCAMGLLCCDTWDEYDVADIAVSLMGMYMLSMLLTCIYCCIRDCERVYGQLFRTKQNQVTNQLAKSMAHAIRNPLTAARGFMQLVSGKKQISEQEHRYCEHAELGIKEADEVITDYLRCAESEKKTPHRLHVQAEIDERVIPEIALLCAQSQIEMIHRHLTNEPMYIAGESDMLYQTILNIATNAVEAMPTGGKLEVTTWLEHADVCVHIKDTGIGMSMQEIKRIGIPYYDTKKKGTGLGLMVVLSLVQAMKGAISYYSQSNKGTECLLKYKFHRGEEDNKKDVRSAIQEI